MSCPDGVFVLESGSKEYSFRKWVRRCISIREWVRKCVRIREWVKSRVVKGVIVVVESGLEGVCEGLLEGGLEGEFEGMLESGSEGEFEGMLEGG